MVGRAQRDPHALSQGHSILKGSFCQPRPKAWACCAVFLGPVGAVREAGSTAPNERFRLEPTFANFPRPPAWADRIGLSGRRKLNLMHVGLAALDPPYGFQTEPNPRRMT